MTPDQVWVPVQRRWADIRPGDVITGRDGLLWAIDAIAYAPDGLHVVAMRAATSHGRQVDPDDTATVLVPMPERDALALLAQQLGAQPLEAS